MRLVFWNHPWQDVGLEGRTHFELQKDTWIASENCSCVEDGRYTEVKRE